MGDRPIHVKRVTTDLSRVEWEAADHAGLDPEETDVVSAKVTDSGELKLTMEGPAQNDSLCESEGNDA